jgi:hypothetical protein
MKTAGMLNSNISKNTANIKSQQEHLNHTGSSVSIGNKITNNNDRKVNKSEYIRSNNFNLKNWILGS